MEVDTTCEMDKVTLLKKTDDDVEFSLPYGWKKFGRKRKNSDNWDFYLISSDNKRFRSNPEIKRYLDNNPNVKCDLSVTNTQWLLPLKNMKKPNPDLKEPESELFIKSKATSITLNLIKHPKNVPRSPLSKNTKDKIFKELEDGMLPKIYDEPTPIRESDSDFSTQQNKKVLIEKIKGIKFARRELKSKTFKSHRFKSLSISSSVTNFSDEDNGVVSSLKHEKEIIFSNPWNVSDLSVYNSNKILVEEDVRANNLKDDPEFDEKHDPLTIKSTNKCPDCDFKREETRLFCDHANDQHENSSALFKNQQYETCQTNLKQEICDNNHETFEVVQKFDNFDEQYSLIEEPKEKSGEQSLDSWANLHDFSGKTNVKQEISNDNDENYEAVQEIDIFDEQYSFHEEPKTKIAQKVARKRSSDSGLNFHDLSEEGYNSNTELVDVIANNLKDDPEFDEKHDPLTIKSLKKEENLEEGDLHGVAAADLKKHECTICKDKFKNKRLLAKHTYDVHEGTKPFKCELCVYGCYKNFDLTKHIQAVHEGKKPFQCEFCEHATARKQRLKLHIQTVHEGKKPFQCQLCGFATITKGLLNKHIEAVHEGKKPFKCEVCEYTSAGRQTLNRHIQAVHEGKKPFQCELCGFASAEKRQIKRHIEAVHEGKKPFKCEICEHTSAGRQSLNRHIQAVHEGKKPFKCEICEYASATKQQLNQHIEAVHEGKKPFQCEICEYTFAHKHDLKKHIQVVHEKKKPFICELCGYASATKGLLNRHIQAVHEGKKPFKCENCKYASFEKNHLVRHNNEVHEKKKPFRCEFCVYAASQKQHLNQHLQANHKGMKQYFHEEFKCEFCAYSFAKKLHLVNHIAKAHSDIIHRG